MYKRSNSGAFTRCKRIGNGMKLVPNSHTVKVDHEKNFITKQAKRILI